MTRPDAQEVWKNLLEGNLRFLDGNPLTRAPGRERSGRLVDGQAPHAAVLCCSDSRVPPEIIFDADLGELFVIRVAGQVLGPEAKGSLEYAVAHLRVPLIVVLGHTHCGLVKAAMGDERPPGDLGWLTDAVLPARDAVPDDADDPLQRCVVENVKLEARQAAELAARVLESSAEKPPAIVAARYDLATGTVGEIP